MPESTSSESKVWRVNVRTRTLALEPVPPAWERLGGRGLVARFLLDEVPPACEPLGPHNKLIFAPGLLVGHMLSSCDRMNAEQVWRGIENISGFAVKVNPGMACDASQHRRRDVGSSHINRGPG